MYADTRFSCFLRTNSAQFTNNSNSVIVSELISLCILHSVFRPLQTVYEDAAAVKVTGKLPPSEPEADALTDPDSPDRLGQLRTVNRSRIRPATICDRSSTPQTMPTARRSDLRRKEKGNPTRADDLGDHLRTNTTVYDRIRYAYSIYTVSIPYPAARAFLFTGGFLPYPAQLGRQFSEKGLTNRLECVIMCLGTHNTKER